MAPECSDHTDLYAEGQAGRRPRVLLQRGHASGKAGWDREGRVCLTRGSSSYTQV